MSNQRIRIRYSKLGRTRYLSARDLTSVWERSLRRAQLPIAYSEGFSPHAKVSFPDALPVGMSSTGEYAELQFAAPIDPGPGLAKLSSSLPEGMDVTTYLEVPDGAPKLAKMLGTTLWELAWPVADVASATAILAVAQPAVEALLAADSHQITKHRPSGDKVVDIRPPILDMALSLGEAPSWRNAGMPQTATTGTAEPVALILRTVLRNGGATVRPPDLVTALQSLTPEGLDPLPATRHACRVAQGALVDEGVKEALTGQVVGLVVPVPAEAA